jgi:hypothetical protein
MLTDLISTETYERRADFEGRGSAGGANLIPLDREGRKPDVQASPARVRQCGAFMSAACAASRAPQHIARYVGAPADNQRCKRYRPVVPAGAPHPKPRGTAPYLAEGRDRWWRCSSLFVLASGFGSVKWAPICPSCLWFTRTGGSPPHGGYQCQIYLVTKAWRLPSQPFSR